jgi:hypothetical protein
MTQIREHPPPGNAPARAVAVTQPGRVAGLDGIRGLAALFVVLNHIFERARPGYPANPAPFWAAWMTYGRFELPFQRHRGWLPLRPAMSARLWQLWRTGPAAVAWR